MNTQHDELARLAAEEPTTRTAPDLATIRSAGRRLRTRRRVTSGIAALAVLGAIGVPTALAASGGPDATTPVGPAAGRDAGASSATPTPAPTPSLSTAPTPAPTETPTPLEDLVGGGDTAAPVCGVMLCRNARPARYDAEPGTVLGEVLPMGTFDGQTEVLYAARVRGVDMRINKAADVAVLMAGIDDAGTLRRTVWALQPGTEPNGQPLGVYGGTKSADEDGDGFHYGVIGYVEGEHDVVQVILPDGTSRAVTGSSTEVLPGWTVFHDTGAWADTWTQDRAPLTYGVTDGPSCAISECSVVG